MDFFPAVLRSLRVQHGDDLIDRLNYYHTSLILLIFAVVVSGKQFVGSPIQCWVPAHFTQAMEKYTNNYCWIQNTWFNPSQEEIPKEINDRYQRQLIYYQWVPLFLCLLAFMAHLPCLFWRIINIQSAMLGMGVSSVLRLASSANNCEDGAVKEKIIQNLVLRLKSQLNGDNNAKKAASIIYLITKLLYCGNIALQLSLIHIFLDTKYRLFGVELIRDLISGTDWQESGVFPRVTLCDFTVRQLANIQRHTVQCVLMINMFNEKFFIFIWFWMCFLWLLTLGNGLIWTWHLFNRHSRYKFVLKQLSVSKRSVQHFAQNHLGADGILILRLISHNCGDYIVSEILAQFWTDYQHLDFSTFNSPRNYEMSESQVAVNERLIGSIRISETPTKEAPNDNNLESKLALKSLSKILTKQTDTERRERVKAREMTKDPNDLLF